jgi:primase-polymerase (primpol)-like protein
LVPKNNSTEMPQKNNPIPVQDESSVAYQKSNAASEIQPDGLHAATGPKQISAQAGAQVASLVLVSAVAKDQIKVENTDLKQQSLQTDNAISVVALDDQNKAITGFFKKLISHNPDDDKTSNTKKVRVSVFQLSY